MFGAKTKTIDELIQRVTALEAKVDAQHAKILALKEQLEAKQKNEKDKPTSEELLLELMYGESRGEK